MSAIHYCDTIIVGSGLAGIAAARTIEQHNRACGEKERISYLVLEADGKIGGRVQSETIAVPGRLPALFTAGPHYRAMRDVKSLPGRKGVVINTGAQWFHKDMRPGTPANPLLADARAADDLLPDNMPRDFYVRGRRENYLSNMRRVKEGRRLIDEYEKPKDTDLDTLFKTHGLGDWSALCTTFGKVETGAPLGEVSAEDVKNLVACNMGDFSLGGLSKFVRNYAKDVLPNIRLHSQVSCIRRHPEGDARGVEIVTKDGDIYRAKQCVLTASIGVLKSGDIKFEPELPAEYRENLSHVSMGNFNKIFLVFDSKFRFPVNHNTHLDVRTKGDRDIFYLGRDNGQPLVTAFFGGDEARLCDTDPDKARELAIRGLSEIWDDDVRSHIIDARVTQWGNNPLVLGGYSRVDIGHHHAREELAKPIDNAIFLAGEALGAKHPESGRNWATHMAGAALSGERAAKLVIAEYAKERPISHSQLVIDRAYDRKVASRG